MLERRAQRQTDPALDTLRPVQLLPPTVYCRAERADERSA